MIKKDLSALEPESDGCARAELSGMIASTAVIEVGERSRMSLSFKTENPAVAGRIFKLMKRLYSIAPEVFIKKTRKFKEHRYYTIALEENEKVQKVLKDTRILRHNAKGKIFFTNEVPGLFLSKQRYIKSYIRGVFLACGSISNPEKTYHLELVCRQKTYLNSLRELMEQYDIKASLITRKGSGVLYMKESESVAGFLNVIGAHKALLEIENIRIIKEMRNGVNRQVNCETANINKTVSAAVKQLGDITYIRDTVGLDYLPETLAEIAQVRLDRPDATLKELGESLDPQVGKSGVNHRLRKISTIAENLRAQKE